jgi:hypothetical protein
MLIYIAAAPGLPPQACELGQCEPNAFPAMAPSGGSTSAQAANSASAQSYWAIPYPYTAGFGLNTLSNNNPAYYAVFPHRDRPTEAFVKDFTLRGVVDGRDAYVRVFKADITLRFTDEAGNAKARTIPVACGMEFADSDQKNNVILEAGATLPAAAGQPYARKFSHSFGGDGKPTEAVVLLASPSSPSTDSE